MSRFFTTRYRDLQAYTPGEQPKGQRLIKLNTNESPFPPPPRVARAVQEEACRLQLYSDPECSALREKLACTLGLGLTAENLIMTNGSDEALYFAFLAFCDGDHPAVFPDITYGFYPVFSRISRVPYREIPLEEDWSVNPDAYARCGGTVFLANPNAPTGRALSLDQVERILRTNPDSVVVVDEAYVDFGGETALSLTCRYDNLLVTRTFSKSRSLAGLRLGFAAGNESLIRDLKTIQYSTNPYNVDRLAQAAGLAVLEEEHLTWDRVRMICETREETRRQLVDRGFEALDSRTNFLFVRHPSFPGSSLRDRLREKGILIRWFDQPRIRDWSRISIGTGEQMRALVSALDDLMKG